MIIHWKRSVACLLLAVCLMPAASAHSHQGEHEPTPVISAWAQNEVDQARKLGLIPGGILSLDSLQVPITRDLFTRMAINYVAVQEQCDFGYLTGMTADYMGKHDEAGNLIPVFSDGETLHTYAYYLGVVEGRGKGIFDPDGLITREEAAVMLTRAYGVLGGKLPESEGQLTFTDEKKIAGFAKESAAALTSWKVMSGMEDGSFAPKDTYTVEQCILTFLRLYENAPVSRTNDNVNPLFTYEQAIQQVESTYEKAEYGTVYETLRVEGALATLLRVEDVGPMMFSASTLLFVHRNGGIQRVDIGLCVQGYGSESPSNFLRPNIALEEPRFSEDGNTFLCSVTMPYDVYNDDATKSVAHANGFYYISVDVETGDYQLQRQELPN